MALGGAPTDSYEGPGLGGPLQWLRGQVAAKAWLRANLAADGLDVDRLAPTPSLQGGEEGVTNVHIRVRRDVPARGGAPAAETAGVLVSTDRMPPGQAMYCDLPASFSCTLLR